jgi:hypothetical protein
VRIFYENLLSLSECHWEELIRQSAGHGTTGLLCDRLLGDASDFLPADLARACLQNLQHCESSLLASLRDLRHVLDVLESAGVDAVPFKGPGLALRVYPKPSLRTFRDLDVLIRPAQRHRALAALLEAGYRRPGEIAGLPPQRLLTFQNYNGQELLFAEGRFPVEPHWALAPRTYSAEIPVEEMMARAVPFEAPGIGRIRGLEPEDMLLVAALHGAKEEWARLVWICDLAAIFHTWPDLNAEVVLKRASQAGCRRMILLAAFLAHDLVSVAPPSLLMEHARADPEVARLATWVKEQLPLRYDHDLSVFHLTAFGWSVRERLRDRLRYAARTILTARVPHFRAVPLPEPIAFLYPAVRIALDALILPVWKEWKRLRRTLQ